MPSPQQPAPPTSTSSRARPASPSSLLCPTLAGSSEGLGHSHWLEWMSIWVLPAAACPHGPLLLQASSLSCQGLSASQSPNPQPREHAYHPTSLAGAASQPCWV